MTLLPYLAILMVGLRQRLHDVRRDERGSFTLEQAVIAACLLALAIGLAAVLITAVTNHENSIK
ncbi:MAG: hypothetical protein ACYDAQ_00575 [Mycobacteriales bacterium]